MNTIVLPPSNRISSVVLFTAVALAPLPFGSTNFTTISFWCIVLGLATMTASLRYLRRGHFALLGLAAIIIAAYGVVLHEQLTTRPWFAAPHPLWLEASKALSVPIEPSVSIERHEPFFALGASLAAMLSVICAFIVCADRVRARQLLKVVAWSGVAYAAYGIAAFVFDPSRILWRDKQAYLDVLTATFVNRNTAAVYFGSCAVVWLLFLSEAIRRHFPHGSIQWRGVLRWVSSGLPRSIILPFAMLFVCLAAMFMTGSRAGIILSLIVLVIAFAVYFRRDLSRRSGVLALLGVGSIAVLVVLQLMGAGVSGRFDRQGFDDGGRLATYRAVLRMISDHPWFGTGHGTFAASYPAYRSPDVSLWGIWDLTHSTPLEMAAELGMPLTTLVIASWIIALATLVHGVLVRRRDVMIPIAAFSVAALALSHSLIDFSLQITGYAIMVFALVGAGLSQSFASERAKNR